MTNPFDPSHPFECQSCGKKFTDIEQMNAHNKAFHGGEKKRTGGVDLMD